MYSNLLSVKAISQLDQIPCTVTNFLLKQLVS